MVVEITDSVNIGQDMREMREEFYVIRKPGPAVLIAASTEEPPGGLQIRTVHLS